MIFQKVFRKTSWYYKKSRFCVWVFACLYVCASCASLESVETRSPGPEFLASCKPPHGAKPGFSRRSVIALNHQPPLQPPAKIFFNAFLLLWVVRLYTSLTVIPGMWPGGAWFNWADRNTSCRVHNPQQTHRKREGWWSSKTTWALLGGQGFQTNVRKYCTQVYVMRSGGGSVTGWKNHSTGSWVNPAVNSYPVSYYWRGEWIRLSEL